MTKSALHFAVHMHLIHHICRWRWRPDKHILFLSLSLCVSLCPQLPANKQYSDMCKCLISNRAFGGRGTGLSVILHISTGFKYGLRFSTTLNSHKCPRNMRIDLYRMYVRNRFGTRDINLVDVIVIRKFDMSSIRTQEFIETQ